MAIGAVSLDPAFPAKDLIFARWNRTIDVYQGGGWFVTQFEALTDFVLDYHEDDQIACAYFDARDNKQILVCRGHGVEGRREGSVEVISCADGERPGDRWTLDRLLNDGGRWASAMTNRWSSEGYLLIVGENEIIPTFTKNWDIEDFGGNGGRVDYTDRNYASTGLDDDCNTPEIAVGRMVGNSADRLSKGLRTAIELAISPDLLSNDQAYCASAPDDEDDGRFVALRDSIATKLSNRGFSVLEQYCPSDSDFFSHDYGRDVFFLAGHGNTTVWGDCLTWSNVFHHFDPGTTRPLVFAMSCRTGRYPEYEGTLSEEFLWNYASGYIGATENAYSYGNHGRGWGPRFAEAFFSRLEASRPVGLSLKLAKQYRLSDAANSYSSDWNKNRYHCAVFHLYGDPKAVIQWSEEAPFLSGAALPNSPALLHGAQGPITELRMKVPPYLVETNKQGHEVVIPGGEVMAQTGRPAVPYYYASLQLPRGTVVQAVELKERSGLITSTGLRLPPVHPSRNALRASPSPASAPPGDWWPDRDFDWSMSENADEYIPG